MTLLRREVLCLWVTVALAPCGADGQIGPSPESEAFARRAIELFVAGELDEGLRLLDPKTLPKDIDLVTSQIRELLETLGPAPTITRVYWWGRKSLSRDSRADDFVFHLVGDERAALAFARVEVDAGRFALKALRWEYAPADLRDRHPFRLWGMSLLHYLVLCLIVLVPAAMVVAAIAAARSELRRKWLWALLSFVGVGKVSLYWLPGPLTSAMIKTRVINVALVGVGFRKFPIYDPWCLTLCVPLGAIFVYCKLRSTGAHRKRAAAEPNREIERKSAADFEP